MIAALTALFLSLAHAATADEVIQAAQDANRVDSSIQRVTLTVVSKTGKQRVKELELKSRRFEGVVKSKMRVLSPSAEAGTAFLLVDNASGNSEQMMYRPSTKRVTLIAGNSRKSAFLASDFSYEDLQIREAVAGTHSLVSDDDTHWIIDTVPNDSPQYSRVRTTITKADHLARKVEFFDLEGQPLKTLEIRKTANDGDVVLAVDSIMSNHQRGTHTTLVVTEHKVNVSSAALPDDAFTRADLERGG